MSLRRLLGNLFRSVSPQPVGSLQVPARFVLTLMRPSVGRHLEVFQEVMEVVGAGLAALGHAVLITVNEFFPGERHIVFCPRLLREEDVERVPSSTILYNFEPLAVPVFDERRAFLIHYAPRFRVWDYSAANVRYLAQLGVNAQHVPLGYAPVLSRIERPAKQDIDVLFYGDMTPRRAFVLDGLRETHLTVVAVTDVYGRERDALIARSKIVLNIHRDEAIGALETPRVFYLLANRKAVVTETKPEMEIDAALRCAMVAVPYDRLVSTCVELAQNTERRRALEEAAFECIRGRDEAAILAAALNA